MSDTLGPAPRALGPGARLTAAGAVLAANRLIRPNMPIAMRGVLDEAAHLATTSLALDALAARAGTSFRAGALAASVLIDVDHVPKVLLGWRGLSAGSARPSSHSLPTLAAAVALARFAAPARREAFRGIAFGLSWHLVRDLTDGSGGVPLLWPLRRRPVRLSRRLQGPLLLGALCARRGARPRWR